MIIHLANLIELTKYGKPAGLIFRGNLQSSVFFIYGRIRGSKLYWRLLAGLKILFCGAPFSAELSPVSSHQLFTWYHCSKLQQSCLSPNPTPSLSNPTQFLHVHGTRKIESRSFSQESSEFFCRNFLSFEVPGNQ